MSSDSDSNVGVEDDEEKKIYQLIYDMYTTDDREFEEKENAHSPSSSAACHLIVLWGNLKAVHDDEDSGNSSSDGYSDVCVTKSSAEHSPVHMECNAERSLHCIDMEAVDNNQERPVQKVNAEKPWRRAGADISDYFNYGFDEESWNTYCKKQTKHRAANAKLSVQKGHNRHGEEKLGCSYFSSASSFTLASRKSSPVVDVTGRQPGSSRGVEEQQCPCDEGNYNQVVTEMSSEEDRITSYHPALPSNFGSLFAYNPPPPFLYRREPPSLSTAATLDSDRDVTKCDDPSTSLYRFSSDVSSLISGTVASSTGVTNTTKVWEHSIFQEKCDKDRDSSTEHGHDKTSKRRRGRERWSCSSQSSAEEQIRHRDTVERGHRRHSFEGDNGDRRHKSEGWQTSSHSSSSSSSSRNRTMRDNDKDRKSQNRRSLKKTRRNVKDKKTNKTFSSDNDEKKT